MYCSCPFVTTIVLQFVLLGVVAAAMWVACAGTVLCAVMGLLRGLVWDQMAPHSLVMRYTWLQWGGGFLAFAGADVVLEHLCQVAFRGSIRAASALVRVDFGVPPAAWPVDVHMCHRFRWLARCRMVCIWSAKTTQAVATATIVLGLGAGAILGFCSIDNGSKWGLAARIATVTGLIAVLAAALALVCKDVFTAAVDPHFEQSPVVVVSPVIHA